MIFPIAFLLSLIIVSSGQNSDFILTTKVRGNSANLPKNKIKGNAKILDSEFFFVKDLTPSEIAQLSSNFIIEKDEIASVNWHLDRIDQRFLPLSGTQYNGSSSNLIDMYIVDTGVDLTHSEFSENNPLWGGNFVNDGVDTDCNGHGTHVASLAVGKDFGSGKKSNLIAVKVLGCNGSGSYSGIIKAVEWITSTAASSGKISIVNMSLGGPANTALDTAIASSITSGIYYVVAAGNSNADACKYSPARVKNAITVAASTITDSKASFSNFGSCVDLYAPGVSLRAAWPNNAFATLSGTSMSSPVASGVLAGYLSRHGRNGYNIFMESLTNNVILNNKRKTPNKLVYFS